MTALALIALAPTTAVAHPRLVAMACEIGGGRTTVLVPRAKEESSDDELICQARLVGVALGAAQLAAELWLHEAGGGVRVVATGMFEALGDGRARIENMIVSHSTWASAVSWRDSRHPRLRIELRAFRKGPTASRSSWRLVTSAQLELGSRGRPLELGRRKRR